MMQRVFSAVRERGGGGGFGRFFRGGGSDMVAPGAYTVAVTIGDETYTTTVEVVRKEGYGFWAEDGSE